MQSTTVTCVYVTTLFQGDEGFRHHTTVAKLWALLTWLLADSLIVPFDARQYALFLHDSMNAVSTQYEKYVKAYALQLESAVQNFTTAAKAFQLKLLHVDKSK
jgi:glutamate carboxypeptidase II (folate hydrolase 1)